MTETELTEEVERLRAWLKAAHRLIRAGFLDGAWAEVVQSQKTLLPARAVTESKVAVEVYNEITKVVGEEEGPLRPTLEALRAENRVLRERLSTAHADLHAARYELAKATRKP